MQRQRAYQRMGEQKTKRRAHDAILARGGECIYCAGMRPIASIEHMPPRAMFRRKDRPKGLEFACCKICNEGTKDADQVASMFGRIYPNSQHPDDQLDILKLLHGLNNNIPGILHEMQVGAGGQKLARKRSASVPLDGGFLRAGGPLVTKYMDIFAAKVAFALHFEAIGNVVPAKGAVFSRWYTNVQLFEGQFPEEVLALLPPPSTLRQGKKEVSEQFQYSCRVDENGAVGLFSATFRHSFAVIAVSSTERQALEDRSPTPSQIWSPGELAIDLDP